MDTAARSSEVWEKVVAAIKAREAAYPGNELRVLEIGAGLLPLLSAVASLRGNFETIHYATFESNPALILTCETVLAEFGLELAEQYAYEVASGPPIQVQRWVGPQQRGACGGMTVSLCLGDITSPEALEAVPTLFSRREGIVGGPNLIVGSCVVDLVREVVTFDAASLSLPAPRFPLPASRFPLPASRFPLPACRVPPSAAALACTVVLTQLLPYLSPSSWLCCSLSSNRRCSLQP